MCLLNDVGRASPRSIIACEHLSSPPLSCSTYAQLIRDIMDLAVADGLTVLRTFAFATDAPYALQTSPGVYNEAVFRGLDYALDQARQRGLKARQSIVRSDQRL